MADVIQIDAFGPPIARKNDPDTSQRAATSYDGYERGKDKAMLLQAVKTFPGRTCAEYSVLLKNGGLDWYKAARMPTKRMSDLVNERSVRVGPARKCEKTGRVAQTYYDV